MSTITNYATIATARAATPNTGGPANWLTPGLVDAPVRCYADYFTAPVGDVASGGVIAFFTDGVYSVLRTGANILFFQFLASTSTSNLTISVGDMNSATRYYNAGAGVAGTSLLTVSGIVSGVPYIIGTNAATTGPGTTSPATVSNGDNQIIVTTGGATLVAATVITGIVFFTLTN